MPLLLLGNVHKTLMVSKRGSSCLFDNTVHAVVQLSEDILPHILPAAAYLQVDLVLSACHEVIASADFSALL